MKEIKVLWEIKQLKKKTVRKILNIQKVRKKTISGKIVEIV